MKIFCFKKFRSFCIKTCMVNTRFKYLMGKILIDKILFKTTYYLQDYIHGCKGDQLMWPGLMLPGHILCYMLCLRSIHDKYLLPQVNDIA